MNNIDPNDKSRQILALGARFSRTFGNCWSMGNPDPNVGSWRDDPYSVGSPQSWVPVLGEVVWQDLRAYCAYVARLDDGRQIGYVRVPDYNYNEEAIAIFEETIDRFEKSTQAMVLDQVNNGGGSMFQMYALLSMMTDRPLALPQHRLVIDDDAFAVAQDVVGDAENGEPIPPEQVSYSRFVLAERAVGRGTPKHLTNPVHLAGITQIVPGKIHYTKKIIVLINTKTFSAGEFLAAILQDNKRATLFGSTTGGGGGCVRLVPFPNKLNMTDPVPCPWTIARRTNGNPIENIGVLPDVPYDPDIKDVKSGYAMYRLAVLAAIDFDF